jgi:hypothetical protein
MRAITTLEHLIAGGYSVTAHCGDCQHSSELNLAALAIKLGPNFVAIATPNPLVERLKCESCGRKHIGLIIGAPGGTTPGSKVYGKS